MNSTKGGFSSWREKSDNVKLVQELTFSWLECLVSLEQIYRLN